MALGVFLEASGQARLGEGLLMACDDLGIPEGSFDFAVSAYDVAPVFKRAGLHKAGVISEPVGLDRATVLLADAGFEPPYIFQGRLATFEGHAVALAESESGLELVDTWDSRWLLWDAAWVWDGSVYAR